MSSGGFTWADVLKPEVMGTAIPILALLVGGILGSIALISRAILGHRERMAMIERGMHPDHPPGTEAEEDQPAGRV